MNIQKKLLPVIVFAKIAVRRVFRDKTALFFTFAFPLIFLFVFGGIFGKNSGVSFKVALVNNSNSEFSKQFSNQLKDQKLFKVSPEVTSLDDAKEKMSRGQLDATIVLPTEFGRLQGQTPQGQAQIFYTQNNEQAGQALTSILQSQLQSINGTLVKTEVPFTAKSERLNTRSLTAFDYTFSGLLGFSIIGLGIFGPVNVFPELKKQGVLRRIHTTPLRTWQYFVANAVSQTVVGLISMVMMFAVAIGIFKLNMAGNYFELATLITLSIVMILGIGLAIGGWAANERQAAPLANIVVFPMMFLSGTFFPRFLMPEWLQNVSNFLPLTPVVDGIRLITTEGKHLTQISPQIGLIGLWLVVIYIIAFRVFRWE